MSKISKVMFQQDLGASAGKKEVESYTAVVRRLLVVAGPTFHGPSVIDGWVRHEFFEEEVELGSMGAVAGMGVMIPVHGVEFLDGVQRKLEERVGRLAEAARTASGVQSVDVDQLAARIGQAMAGLGGPAGGVHSQAAQAPAVQVCESCGGAGYAKSSHTCPNTEDDLTLAEAVADGSAQLAGTWRVPGTGRPSLIYTPPKIGAQHMVLFHCGGTMCNSCGKRHLRLFSCDLEPRPDKNGFKPAVKLPEKKQEQPSRTQPEQDANMAVSSTEPARP